MPAAPSRTVERLEDIPNVGPSIAANLRYLGFSRPRDLVGRDPFEMYDEINLRTGSRHDPCLLDVFIAAVRYMEGGPQQPWWAFTTERKSVLAARK
jgi:hypothetical protein